MGPEPAELAPRGPALAPSARGVRARGATDAAANTDSAGTDLDMCRRPPPPPPRSPPRPRDRERDPARPPPPAGGAELGGAGGGGGGGFGRSLAERWGDLRAAAGSHAVTAAGGYDL